MTPLPIFTFFPPAPTTEREGNDQDTAVATYQALGRSFWAEKHALATDGSRAQDATGGKTVGAAFYNAVTSGVVIPRYPGRSHCARVRVAEPPRAD